MIFTYSIIHNYGSEIDLRGIFHLILSSILRSFHLWILCVVQDKAFQVLLNSSPVQHYFGTLSKVFWPEHHWEPTDFSGQLVNIKQWWSAQLWMDIYILLQSSGLISAEGLERQWLLVSMTMVMDTEKWASIMYYMYYRHYFGSLPLWFRQVSSSKVHVLKVGHYPWALLGGGGTLKRRSLVWEMRS